jgi:hypothetical protein
MGEVNTQAAAREAGPPHRDAVIVVLALHRLLEALVLQPHVNAVQPRLRRSPPHLVCAALHMLHLPCPMAQPLAPPQTHLSTATSSTYAPVTHRRTQRTRGERPRPKDAHGEHGLRAVRGVGHEYERPLAVSHRPGPALLLVRGTEPFRGGTTGVARQGRARRSAGAHLNLAKRSSGGGLIMFGGMCSGCSVPVAAAALPSGGLVAARRRDGCTPLEVDSAS